MRISKVFFKKKDLKVRQSVKSCTPVAALILGLFKANNTTKNIRLQVEYNLSQ